jgi:hypothetical protein
MMLFVKDVLHTDKDESSLKETCKPVEAQKDFNEGEETEGPIENNFETPSPCAPSPVPSVSSRPCSVSSASSGGQKKKKKLMCQDDEFLHVEKRKLEMLENDLAREEDEDLLFLKTLIPDIQSLPRW